MLALVCADAVSVWQSIGVELDAACDDSAAAEAPRLMRGIATAAKIPMITATMTSSMSEKPDRR